MAGPSIYSATKALRLVEDDLFEEELGVVTRDVDVDDESKDEFNTKGDFTDCEGSQSLVPVAPGGSSGLVALVASLYLSCTTWLLWS